MKQPLFFRIYKDGQLLEIKQLTGTQVVIGSNDDVEISLKDETVSPIHAMIEERDSGYFICDLGSGSGTRKNGINILDTDINSGDEFEVGDYRIEFYLGVPKPKSRPPRVTEAVAPPSDQIEKDELYDSDTVTLTTTLTPTPIASPTPTPTLAKIETPKTESPKVAAKELPKAASKVTEPPKAVPKAPVKDEEPKITPAKVTPATSKAAQNVQPLQASKPGGWQKVDTPAKAPSGRGGLETVSSASRKKGYWPKTFAPTSANKNLNDVIKPTKGSVVEIIVAWKERIIATYHYDQAKTVTVGSHPKNDIVLPVFGSPSVSYPLVKVEGLAKVFLTSELKGELVTGNSHIPLSDLNKKGRAEPSGAGVAVTLQQGELIKVEFNDMVSVYVRYAPQAPKAIAGPALGVNPSELTAIIGSAVLVLFIALYFAVYMPAEALKKEEEKEPPRKAVFAYKPKIDPIDVSQPSAPPPDNAKLADKKTAKQEKTPVKKPEQKAAGGDPGKASEAAPNKSASKEVKLTTPVAGTGKGIQKGAQANKGKSDAQGASAQKDVTKLGLLSTLSGKGTQDKLSQAYSGAGVVGGLSQKATGSGSSSAVGAGDVPGEGLKDIGKGGKGEATVGIAGVNTKGRGSGISGYGTGSIGDKKGITVIPGGSEESFEGTIDREAIRRVINENLRQIRACYERGLNRDPGLHGKVILSWTIGARGIVTQAGVASTTMNNSEVEKCFVSRLKTWRFPEPPVGQEADVTYPFVFAAQQ